MKLINKLWLSALVIMVATACDKVNDLPFYANGAAPVLTSSATTFAPAAADSTKTAITFSWTNPNYSADSAKTKYIIEVDSSGRNFSKAVSKVVVGSLSTSFTAKELNTILLGFGFEFGKPYDVDVRIISSYNNNNERMIGNTIKLRATPYKVPPKIALPSTGRLFITGNATDFDWTNPNPMPAIRELTRIEETKWAGIFHLSGAGEFLILQQAGNWDDKYAIADKSIIGVANGGSFGFKLNDNFVGAVTGGNGWYKLTLDFQTGTFTVKKVDNALPSELYITGDATASSWTNTPPANQKFTQVTNGVFELSTTLIGGKAFKFLSSSGNWQPQFGGSSATGGVLGANYGGGADPDNVPSSAAGGNYKIQVNFINASYTVTKI